MTTPAAAMTGVPYDLQTAATTGNGNVLAIPPSFRHHRLTIKGIATVSTGAVQPEAADEYDYAGTWGQIGGGPITVLDAADIVVNFEGTFNFIRVRVSTDITGGGSVSVSYSGAR
jgi:hypothetical protein